MNASLTSITGTYDYRLVALSLIIAVLTSFTALDLAARVTAHRGLSRAGWLAGGALAMGSGIWCMHYTGMLAYRLPIPVHYNVPTVILSLVAAAAASGIALYVVSRDKITPWNLAAGSLFMGSGIAAMHYTGMAAMRMRAMHHYDAELMVLSVVLAVAVSFAGLLIIFYTRGENRGWMRKLAAGITLGLAIPLMHYTGMAAIRFMPTAVAPNLYESLDISTLANLAILIVTFLILGFALVISLVDRKLTAQQLFVENKREMLRALIDNVPDSMFVKDRECRFVIANPAAAAALGAGSHQDLIGKTDFDFLPRDLAEAKFDDEQYVIATGESLLNYEEESLDLHGDRIPVLVTKVPLRDGQGNITGIAGVGRDISERKRSEEALREAEKRYRGMFDQALFAIFQVGPQGHLRDVNPAMAELMGYASPAEMLSIMTDPLWNNAVSSERHLELETAVRAEGYVKAFELEIFRKDRSTVWVSSCVRSLLDRGVVTGFEGMCEDVTERKLLREQLLHAQKLESVGQLAAGIAHEINTPTQYIGDNVRFLKDTFEDLTGLLEIYGGVLSAASAGTLTPETIERAVAATEKADLTYLLHEIPSAFDQALEGITRVSTLVSAVKDFSHPGMIEKMPLNLNQAIESTITVARNEWKYVAEMETCLDASLPLISCQPGSFNQVILNLIVNAAHAIAERYGNSGQKGCIKIGTQNSPAGVEIRVEDTGSGIPFDVRTRIFDPFFTTKEIGKGTGQGLAITRSIIVDKHAGSISFETFEGEGTTFIIRLPHDGAMLHAKAVTA